MWAEDDNRRSWDANYPIKKRLHSIIKLTESDVFCAKFLELIENLALSYLDKVCDILSLFRLTNDQFSTSKAFELLKRLRLRRLFRDDSLFARFVAKFKRFFVWIQIDGTLKLNDFWKEF